MTITKGSRRSLTFLFAAGAVMSVALPASAADVVTQAVTSGARSASVANLALASVPYSHSSQTSTGTMTLTADDSSGTNLGWNVTILSSSFAYSGGNGGSAIPATNFALTSAATPVKSAGQNVDPVNGPKVPVVSPVGTLDAARKTIQAAALSGRGTYTQALGVSLDIPATTVAGTYTATLVTSITAAP